jgi:hypothetical protein
VNAAATPRDETAASVARPNLLNFMRFLRPGPSTTGSGAAVATELFRDLSQVDCKSFKSFRLVNAEPFPDGFGCARREIWSNVIPAFFL